VLIPVSKVEHGEEAPKGKRANSDNDGNKKKKAKTKGLAVVPANESAKDAIRTDWLHAKVSIMAVYHY
jgi:hypothetical protein